MNDALLDKYVNRSGGGGERQEAAEAVDDLGCFGVLRGSKERSPSIELRRKTGSVLVIGYGWIESMEFDPTEGVSMKLGGRSIRLKGRNLGAELRSNLKLISALAAHRVAWIQEAGGADGLLVNESIPVVEAIEW